jgi:NAD kinase
MLSVDGRMDMALEPGTVVHIDRSPYTATFLRSGPPNQFYANLTERLSPDFRSATPRVTSFT